MRALNEALIERKVEARYVTLLVLLWDPATRQIVMANAGALPPMICRGGEILKIRVEGVPLGLLESREYEEVDFQARAGRYRGALLGRHHRPFERRRTRIRPRPPVASGARRLRQNGGGIDRRHFQGYG